MVLLSHTAHTDAENDRFIGQPPCICRLGAARVLIILTRTEACITRS